ncbi:MAG: hypothetical protein GX490_00590 [Bacilli bacterium]|nr:hypothetical protein [Bacilli bacterium]
MQIISKSKKVLTVLVLLVTGFVLTLSIDKSLANIITKETDLFTNAKDMTIIADQEAPASFKLHNGETTQRDFDIDMKGVLLKSSKNGAKVDLTPTFTGNFELTFRAYSATNFHDVSGSDWNSATIEINPYADLREVTFTFENDEGQSFDVIIRAGEKYNTITPAARVRIAGADFGYHYNYDALVPSETALKNSGGYFTRIGGTTFSNVTRRGGTLTSEKSMPVTFGFNQETMEIYVIHYGISATRTGDYRVVADLDNPEMGLRGFKSFDNYKVSISMTEITPSREANLIVYSINGQSLAGETFTNNIGPNIMYQPTLNGIVNQKYYLEKPAAYDLLEGKIDFNGKVVVKDNNGTKVTVYDADGNTLADDLYTDGAYFIPQTTGQYTLTYTAYDQYYLEGTPKSVTIDVYESLPDAVYFIEGNYQGLVETNTVGVNTLLTIYPAKASSLLYRGDDYITPQVTLLKDGDVYEGISKVLADEAVNVTLKEAGSYRIIYSIPGYTQGNKYEVEFTVSNSHPAFVMSDSLYYIQANNQTINIPTVQATLGGETKQASAFVYGPDGARITTTGGELTLERVGTYKITYMVRFNEVYYYHYYFAVNHSGDNLFIPEDTNVDVDHFANSGNLYPSQYNGVKITARANNKAATYREVIDLSNNTKNDLLIELMVLPKTYLVHDTWQFTVRLTDAHNPQNYVDITVFKGSWGDEWSYVKAGSSEQLPAGWENGKVLTAYNTGTPISFSFVGKSNFGAETMRLYYDNAEKAVYVDNIKRPGYSYGNQVIDLDDPQCFPENFLWDGFTTGEVILSISFQYMQASEASLLVKNLNGIELGNPWISDEEAPIITVNTEGYNVNNLPVGLVNTPYPIFNARSYDRLEGVIETSVKVYKDYQKLTQKEYQITDGKFTPDSTGTYTFLYTSRDASGNISYKTVSINVVDSVAELDYQFDKPLPTNLYVGEKLVISDGIASGGSGNKTVSVKVLDPDGNEVTLDKQILMTKAGTYKVNVTVTDFLGNSRVISHNINVTLSEYPIVADFYLHPILLNGVEYILPDFEAIDYISEQQPVDAVKSIKVKYNGQAIDLGQDRKFTPNVQNHQDQIEVIYVAKSRSSDKAVEKSFTVTVLKAKGETGIDMTKYFMTEGITRAEATNQYIEFFTNTSNAQISFANAVVANGFKFEITVPKATNNVDKIIVTLYDSENPEIAVDIMIYKNSSQAAATSYLSINGGEKMEVAGSFYDVTTYGLSVSYNQASKYLIDVNGNKSLDKIRTTKYGEVFNGFTSGKVYVNISFGEVTGEASLRVQSINNQIFSQDTLDRIRPEVQLVEPIMLTGEINAPFKAPRAIAADVLDPNVTLTLEIKNASGTVYKGPIDADYIFNPTEYGVYRFIYTATDSSNRSSSTTYIVTIKDRIKPSITLNGKVPQKGQVNKDITLPTATVQDNFAEEMRLWIFVVTPEGEIRALPEGTYTFTPTLRGLYRITYYVQDDYNNYVYETYTIDVQ